MPPYKVYNMHINVIVTLKNIGGGHEYAAVFILIAVLHMPLVMGSKPGNSHFMSLSKLNTLMDWGLTGSSEWLSSGHFHNYQANG